MKCPQCGDPTLSYTVKHSKRTQKERLSSQKSPQRTDFTATCKKCHWTGEIRD